MPSPLIHSSLALALDRLAPGGGARRRLALSLSAAVLPDLDLLPGALLGDPHRFHHRHSHAVPVAAALAGLLAVPPWPRRPGSGDVPYRGRFAFFLALCLSHPLLDLFNDDGLDAALGYHDRGIALMWPLSSKVWDVFYPLLPTATIRGPWTEWFAGPNLRVLAFDLALGTAVIAAAVLWRRRARG